MRTFRRLCLILLVVVSGGGPAWTADQLPAYCGPVGVARYQMQGPPAAPPEPVVPLQKGAVITVTNTTDVVNGNVSSPSALMASPGPDGISLREAITATNNSPGTYTIQFDPKLRGATITLSGPAIAGPRPALPPLTGGNVIIDGDIDGDGQPHVTLTGAGSPLPDGFVIESSGNTLHTILMDGFGTAVDLYPSGPDATLSNNTVSHMIIRNVNLGIYVGHDQTSVSHFSNTLIVGNRIDCANDGIWFGLFWTAGSSLQKTTIIRNTVRGGNDGGIILQAGYWAGSTGNSITDAEISDNILDGPWQAGIWLTAGEVGASGNHLNGIRVERNQVIMEPGSTTLFGLQIIVGDAGTDWSDPFFLPFTYPDDNEISNLQVLSNSVTGQAARGIDLQLGWGGAENNSIHDVGVSGNDVEIAAVGGIDSMGIRLLGPEGVSPAGRKPARNNQMRNVAVQANTVRISGTHLYPQNGVIALTGGDFGGINGSLQDVWISHNDLDGSGSPEINIYGGAGDTTFSNPAQDFVSTGNTINHVEAWCNIARQSPPISPTEGMPPSAIGVTVFGGINGATGNLVQGIRLQNNLVGGVLNRVSVQDNWNSAGGPAATGNTASLLSIPLGTPDANPARLMSAASVANVPLAAGSIASLHTAAPTPFTQWTEQTPLPTSVAGVSVQVNGIAAPLLSVSPAQTVFQVPWEVAGGLEASVTLTAGGATSFSQPLSLAVASPGLLSLDGSGSGQALAVIAGTWQLAAPWIPVTRPAARGELVMLYGTGLGAANPQPATGAGAAPGSVAVAAPTVTIGGVPAVVVFSELVPGTAGLWQTLVQVPAATPTGNAVPVVLTASEVASNSVTIAVQ